MENIPRRGDHGSSKKDRTQRRIGIATCVGLIEESRIFARILKLNGFDVYGVACKVGSVDKTDIGLDPKYICKTGPVMCNPILQAKLLNKAGTS